MSTSNASVTATLEDLARDLRARGQHATAREIEKQIPGARTTAKRASVPARDPRLAKMDALVASLTGKAPKVGTRSIGAYQFAGVDESYTPR